MGRAVLRAMDFAAFNRFCAAGSLSDLTLIYCGKAGLGRLSFATNGY